MVLYILVVSYWHPTEALGPIQGDSQAHLKVVILHEPWCDLVPELHPNISQGSTSLDLSQMLLDVDMGGSHKWRYPHS